MYLNLTKLASIFQSKAQILPLGGSTTTPEEAFSIGAMAENALNEIDQELIVQYDHDAFKTVMQMLSDKKLPSQMLLQQAVQEWNSGIKHFSNMTYIPVQKLLYVM